MEIGEVALAVLIAGPFLGALACLPLGRSRALTAVTGVTVTAIAATSIILLWQLYDQGFEVLEVAGGLIQDAGLAIEWAGVGLAVLFLYLGWRTRSVLVGLFAVGDIVALIYLILLQGETEGPPLLVDNLSLILVLITSLVGSVITIYALRYMEHDRWKGQFFAVTLLFLGAMNGAVVANDLHWFELFWGLTTLASFLLIGHTRTEEARKAARWALVINTGGGLAIIVSIVLAQDLYGTLAFSEMPIGGLNGIALLPLALMAAGAFTKSAQLPFQSWLLGAMVAPTPVSALLHSSTMVNLGVYLLLRLSPNLEGIGGLTWAIALVGGGSFLMAAVLAVTQSNAKRVLAYSTISNLGLMIACVGIGTPLAVAAAVVLLLYHAISKALLFLSVGVVKETTGSEDIEDMLGLRTRMPFVALVLFIGMITIVLPPFGMFAAKWLISEAAVAFPVLIFLLAAGFGSTVVFYFKWLGAILSSGPGVSARPFRGDSTLRAYRWTLGALAAGAVVLSVLIGPVLVQLVRPFIERFYDSPIETNNFYLYTSLGEFPVFLFLLLAALVFLGLGFLLRPRAEEVSVPYACGEVYEGEIVGEYYLGERWVKLSTTVSEGVGVLLVAVLVTVPLLLEVT